MSVNLTISTVPRIAVVQEDNPYRGLVPMPDDLHLGRLFVLDLTIDDRCSVTLPISAIFKMYVDAMTGERSVIENDWVLPGKSDDEVMAALFHVEAP